MINSLKSSFNSYTKNPFLAVWSSLMYVLMLVLFFFAAFGLLLVYFFFLSIIGQTFSLDSIASIGFIVIVALTFLFFTNGLNAGLTCAYRAAFWKEKMTITAFFNNALDRAPQMFAIQLLRDLVWLVLAGPVIALYFYVLVGVPYMDWIAGLVILMITFIVHMIFTPAFISAGAFDSGLYGSLRNGFNVLRRKHVMFIGLYILFAFIWVLNFIPFVQLVTIFFLYPILHTAIIVMVENSGKTKGMQKEEDE